MIPHDILNLKPIDFITSPGLGSGGGDEIDFDKLIILKNILNQLILNATMEL